MQLSTQKDKHIEQQLSIINLPMKLSLFAQSILLVVVAAFTGCSSEDPETTTPDGISISFVHEAIAGASEPNYEKEDLPVWLTEYIYSLKPDNIRDVAAFQSKWKGEAVYYVYDDYHSCITCSTFKSDGEMFDWTKTDPKKFWQSVSNWEMIYLSKSKIHGI